jgi:hypothetical protein
MANRKISDLTALTAPATGDLLPIVDISEAVAADKNKKITYGELLASAPAGSAAAPSFSFDGDPNSGLYSAGADQVAISTNGTQRLTTDTAAVTSTLPVVHPLGAAATPSLTFTGDLNTGIYSPGADQVAVATNGTGRLFVDSAGNVAIGRSPSSTFGVYVSDLGLEMGYSSPLGGAYLQGYNRGAGPGSIDLIYYLDGSANHRFVTGGNERLRITAAGLVGVGTSTPAYTLVAKGGVATTGIVASIINPVSGGNSKIHFTDDATYNWTAGTVGNAFAITPSEASTSSGTPALYIDSSSRVGIGNSIPGSFSAAANQLVVGSGSGANGVTIFGSASNIFFSDSTASPSVGFIQYEHITDALRFGTNDATRLYIDSSGRLGIGTTSPSANGLVTIAETTNARLYLTDNTLGNTYGAQLRGYGVGGNGGYAELGVVDANIYTKAITVTAQANNIVFGKGATEKARLDASGRLLVGTSTSRGNLFNGTGNDTNFQLEGTTYGGSSASFIRNSNNSSQSYLVLGKTRGAAVGGTTVVNASDSLGTISFQGSDGTELVEAASITTLVDGTPGANDMPGALVFSTTADGASSPTERLRITSTGQVRLAGAGITFNGDTAAANELDDYEEGTCLPTTGTWTNAGSTYTKIGRMVYVEIRGDVATTPQAIALPFAFGDVCIGGYVLGTTTFNGITNGVNASAAGTTITLPVGFIKGFLSYRAN